MKTVHHVSAYDTLDETYYPRFPVKNIKRFVYQWFTLNSVE